jgi:hypothetical protein
MTVAVDTVRHEVILTTAQGRTITLTWAAAVNLGSLLVQKGHEAEPVVTGKSYCPSAGHGRV